MARFWLILTRGIVESWVDVTEAQKVAAFAAKFAMASDIGQPLDDELANSVNY